MKYRKAAVVVQAFQYDGDFIESNGVPYAPSWALQAMQDGILYYQGAGELYVKTLEGVMHIPVGNYIIQGVAQEIYSCAPEIFKKTYEPVEVPVTPCFPGQSAHRGGIQMIKRGPKPKPHYPGSPCIDCQRDNFSMCTSDGSCAAWRAWYAIEWQRVCRKAKQSINPETSDNAG